MADLLVKLYDLPDDTAVMQRVADAGVVIRHAMPYDLHKVRDWVTQHFTADWAAEATSVWSRQPIPCLLAIRDGKLLGFASYDTTSRGFFGPTGVDEAERGQGIGAALLHAALRELKHLGYGYAFIGWAGPVAWYAKTVGATVIEGSEPGVYAHGIKVAE
ncbi:MAG: GNAT family N-acetyltransferase [Planctomycetota bacterium]